MKRILVLSLALLMLMACACTDNNININVDDAAATLLENCSFDDELVVHADKSFAMSIIGIDDSLVAKENGVAQIAFANSAAKPDMIIVIKAVSEQAANTLNQGAIEDWVQYYHDGYSDYGPDQVPKIDDAVRRVVGEYVFLIISADANTAGEALNALVG